MLRDEEMAAIAARCARATPGPWTCQSTWWGLNDGDGRWEHTLHVKSKDPRVAVGRLYRDEGFIAAARQDVPFLLDLLQRLRQGLDVTDEERGRLRRIRGGAARVTPGPWLTQTQADVTKVEVMTAGGVTLAVLWADRYDGTSQGAAPAHADAHFIAHARNDIARLLGSIAGVTGTVSE